MTFTQRKRIPRTIDFACDGCSSEFLETDAHSLRDAMHDLRENNWVVTEMGGEFGHYCPDCSRRMGID